MMVGAGQFNKYSGYGKGIKFAGDFVDGTKMDSSNCKDCRIVDIDALNFRRKNKKL